VAKTALLIRIRLERVCRAAGPNCVVNTLCSAFSLFSSVAAYFAAWSDQKIDRTRRGKCRKLPRCEKITNDWRIFLTSRAYQYRAVASDQGRV